MSIRSRTWGALAKAVLTPLLWCSMRPKEGFHKAVLCLRRGLLKVICHLNSTSQQGAKPGDPHEVRESLAIRGLF